MRGVMASSSRPATSAASGKWLIIVGIGEDGVAGLGDAARAAIAGAAHVFGGERHLALAAELISGQARAWPTPFDAGMQAVCKLAGEKVCVLASGDPFHHGVGVTLARHIPVEEMRVLPAPSSFSLAAARMGWALQDTDCISLHGRPIELIRPLLHPGRRVLALTSDGEAPSRIAALLTKSGFGPSTVTVLEALGGEQERVLASPADDFRAGKLNPLNMLAIEVDAGPEARILTLARGLPDHLFEHDGQITKREIRAVTLSALAPRRGELLWDVGAGSGSIGIEWMLCDPSMRAIAVEADAERAARLSRNAAACGVPGLKLVEGEAPAALAGLPQPDAIFIGGGATADGVMPAAIDALGPGGRLVVNGVTLETEAMLLDLHARLGGDLTRLAVSRAGPVGTMTGWRAAMPITQWSWTKP